MRSLSTYKKLYRDFSDIEEGAYHTVVRFYEAKVKEIDRLDFSTYFEITLAYTTALFEIGAYQKHIEEVDKIIQLSIAHNIQFYKGEDVYFKSLFQKAASFYNTLAFDKAEYILKELIKMAPYHGLSIRFLRKCALRRQPTYIKTARAASIACFLLAALLAAAEVIVIHPFIPNNALTFEYLRYAVFGGGVLILGLAFLYHRFSVHQTVYQFVQSVRKKK
ncbi:MAG: hypothetical protein AAF960_29640 [Bacteroidota bacterium]